MPGAKRVCYVQARPIRTSAHTKMLRDCLISPDLSFPLTSLLRPREMPSKCKERERLFESGVADIPALPVGAVRGLLCFRCFEPSDTISKCAACKRAGYCSKSCQKLDWFAVHKKQCKILGRINEIDLEDYKETRTWDEYRASLVGFPKRSCLMGG